MAVEISPTQSVSRAQHVSLHILYMCSCYIISFPIMKGGHPYACVSVYSKAMGSLATGLQWEGPGMLET